MNVQVANTVLLLSGAVVLAILMRALWTQRSQLSLNDLPIPTLLASGNIALLIGNEMGRLVAGGGAVAFLLLALVRRKPAGTIRLPLATRLPALWGLVLWAWIFVVDVVRADGMSRLGAHMAAGVLALGIVAWSNRGGVPARSALGAVLTLLAATALTAPFASTWWTPCTESKCSPFGALFTGPFPSENYIALLSVVAFVLSAMAYSGWMLIGLALLPLTITVAAGSRSALFTLGLIIAWMGIQAMGERLTRAYRRAGPIIGASGVVLLLSVGVGVALLFTAERDTLSSRGDVWRRAIDALQGQELAGVGLSQWDRLTSLGVLPDHFAHSEYLFLLFSGGFVGLSLFALWGLACIRRMSLQVGSARSWRTVGPTMVIFLIGLTEVTWNPASVDGLSWVAATAALMVLTGHAQEQAATRDDAARSAVSPRRPGA